MARLAERNIDLALAAVNRPTPLLLPLAGDLLRQRAREAIRQVEQIAALDPQSDDPVALMQQLMAQSETRRRRLTERVRQMVAARQTNRALIARLETAAHEQTRLQQQIDAQSQQLDAQQQQIDQLHAEAVQLIDDYTNQIAARDQTIDQQQQQLAEQTARIDQQAVQIDQQREQIATFHQTIDQQQQQLTEQASQSAQQANELDQRQQQIVELDRQIELYYEQIAQRDRRIVGYYEQIAQRETIIDQQQQIIAERDHLLAESDQRRRTREQQIAEQEQARAAEIKTLTARRNYLQQQLDNAYATRAWRAASLYWRTRDTLLRSPYRLVRDLYRQLIPTPWRLRFRDYRAGRLQTAYAYAFDLYRRRRSAVYGDDLRGLTVPADSGLVSIVLPVYNGADMLSEAVESILWQTYRHFELIIVNDGSTDESGGLADDYAQRDSRVRVIHQPNQKLPRALSNGFRTARGAFLTWTSADNRLKPDFLAQMVACLQRHPNWDMIYANLDIIGEDGTPLRGSAWYQGYQRPNGSGHVHLPVHPAELNTLANNVIGAAFMYRAHTAALLGDYSPLRFKLEDYDYWMRVNALLTLRHTDFDQPVYEYRFHPKSLTARHLDEIIRSREQLMTFDTFRRDFALAPLLWVIDGEAPTLKQRLQAADHLLYENSFPLDQLPLLWTPTVYVCVSEQAVPFSRADLPNSALTVLVVTGSGLIDQIDPSWDVAVAFGHRDTLPRLPRAYQGWLAAADADTLFRLIDIRAKSEHLRQLEALVEAPPAPERRASVVICTHRFNERLLATIRAAAAQCCADDELIVVNNQPNDNQLDRSVEQVQREFFPDQPDRLRLMACPQPGLSAARNAGIAAARGEIIAFLDDDALPAPGWLDEIARAFAEHPQTGVIGGHIELKIPQPRPDALRPGWEKYWSQYVTGFSDYAEVDHWWEFPWGANWSARRAALLRIGGFRLNYGRSGSNFWGGEELVAACQIHQAGYAVAILPSARVLHDVEESRFTFRHVRQTLAAGRLVYYLIQRDLFIPSEFEPVQRPARPAHRPQRSGTGRAAAAYSPVGSAVPPAGAASGDRRAAARFTGSAAPPVCGALR